MAPKRSATSAIWRAVVVAGAMLGAAPVVGCTVVSADESVEDREEMAKRKKKKKPVAKADAAPPDAAIDAGPPDARPRASKDKPRGRGFVIG